MPFNKTGGRSEDIVQSAWEGVVLAPVHRRMVLTGSATLLAGLATGCSSEQSVAEMPEVDRLKLIRATADITIPPTDTDGAGTMETVRWVDKALTHGMRGATSSTLPSLKTALDRKTPGGSFIAAARPVQVGALTALDAELPSSPGADLAPWAIVKSIILRGYYTSETGASRELLYELSPGRFDTAVPVEQDMRTWSTDQNARNFS